MKKVLSILALSMLVFSCTIENNVDLDGNTSNKGVVNFKVVTENTTSTSSKNIDRGNIPVYVDNLTIKAESRAQAGYIAQETFQFTGSPSITFPLLSLENIALGMNTFSATSTSAAVNKVLNFTSSNVVDLNVQKAKTPYIPCYSYDNPSPEIKLTGNAPVTIKMKSDYGRIMSLFKLDNNAKKYVIIIKAYLNNSTTTVAPDVIIRPETVNRTAVFEWSNDLSIKNAKVRFDILICEAVSNTVLNSFSRTLDIQAEKSISCIFTINKNDVETDIKAGGLLITFPKIEEINCPNSNCD